MPKEGKMASRTETGEARAETGMEDGESQAAIKGIAAAAQERRFLQTGALGHAGPPAREVIQPAATATSAKGHRPQVGRLLLAGHTPFRRDQLNVTL
jgi:hypothetical protein